MPSLFATSDLHVSHGANATIVEEIQPDSAADWLLVAGDVAEQADTVIETLWMLADRFATVVWVPGNHDLWTTPRDPVQLHGQARYEYLVRRCREIGVYTPEDEYPVWEHGPYPRTIVPLFLLYDYSWRTPEAHAVPLTEALSQARAASVVCTDEYFLHPEPYAGRAQWCARRLEITEQRLVRLPSDRRTILLSHWPLHRHPTEPLYWPEFAMWCGTQETTDWHLRYCADIAVYGHLHIPRTTYQDGVRFEEVSLGYPREWRKRTRGAVALRKVL